MDLEELRKYIDELDEEILFLLSNRFNTVKKIIQSKKINKQETRNLHREKLIYQRLHKINKSLKNPLDDDLLESIFCEIILSSISVQNNILQQENYLSNNFDLFNLHNCKISCLGPKWTFSYEALYQNFNFNSDNIIFANNIKQVCNNLYVNEADYAILPIENSITGKVFQSLYCLSQIPNINILCELEINVEHNLISFVEKQDDIEIIYGHNQSIAQCQGFLDREFPNTSITYTNSTTAGIEFVKNNPLNTAGISSYYAAKKYNIRIIRENIADSHKNENKTRFLLLSKHQVSYQNTDYKTMIILYVNDSIGVLSKSLEVFRENKINLTMIESYKDRYCHNSDYCILIEFKGHMDNINVKNTIEQLNKYTLKIKYLGSYITWKKKH